MGEGSLIDSELSGSGFTAMARRCLFISLECCTVSPRIKGQSRLAYLHSHTPRSSPIKADQVEIIGFL
jgi:hypothetical protein